MPKLLTSSQTMSGNDLEQYQNEFPLEQLNIKIWSLICAS